MFESLNTPKGEQISLDEYIGKMPAEQKEIYYISGERRELLENTPYLEVFKDRGWDVLLLTDPIDEFVIPHLPEYNEKPLKAANEEKLESDESADLDEAKEAYLPLLEALRSKLEGVKEVRLSTRLRESASCIVNEEGAMGENMKRILKRLNQQDDLPETEKILELNPNHPVVLALRKIYETNPEDPKIENYGQLLYDQAIIAEGTPLKNPAAFAKRVNELLIKDADE